MGIRQKFASLYCKNALLVSTIGSVLFGICLGIGLRPLELSAETQKLILFPGTMFMSVLKMMILPLIFSSLISALAQMDPNASGRMGLATLVYYFVSATLATILGVFLVTLIHPGNSDVKELSEAVSNMAHISPLDTILDLVRNMLPENIVRATFEKQQTVYVKDSNGTLLNEAGEIVSKQGTNILGIIVFCSGFGIALSKMGERAKPVVDFFKVLDEAILRWVKGLMWIAPIGICCLVCGNLLEMQDPSSVATVLLAYVVTVLTGLLIHSFVVLPIIVFLVTRKNPITIVKGMIQPVMTTLGTSTGFAYKMIAPQFQFRGAVLPISIQSMEENCGVDRRIAGFVLPLGCTINMDGNALYEAVAVIFVAQLNNINLNVAEIVAVSVTATLASIGMNNVPAGLVSILIILNTIGLPIDDVALLLTVDWLLDRVRSALNVLGDGYATVVIAHVIQDSIHQEEPTADKSSNVMSFSQEDATTV